MNLKGMLKVSTSLMVVCAGFMSSFAQAEDYVTKSQVNTANGVAGLNASKQVTADVYNSRVATDALQLNKKNNRLRFVTNSGDTNNNEVDIFYNRDAGNKDFLGNVLDPETFYFTNNRYGNNYKFNGVVTAGGLKSTGSVLADNMYIGFEKVSPYQTSQQAGLVFLSKYGYDNANVRPNTLMLGGNTRNSLIHVKASCQNTSGGDLGGSCYQFTNMGGLQTNHRSGAGDSDGINMDMRSTSNSPLDTIGGNTLTKNADGKYSLIGSNYPVFENVKAGSESFEVKGSFGCGIGGGQSRCEMSGANVLDSKGDIFDTVTVKAGRYNPKTDTTLLSLASGYTLQKDLTNSDEVTVKFYSADGVAYGIDFAQETNGQQYAVIYPALSPEESGLLEDRMAIWTNIANNMASQEGGTNEDASNVDMPNYYYGYNAGRGIVVIDKDTDTTLQNALKAIANDTTTTQTEKNDLTKQKQQEVRSNQYTKLYIQTYYYPNVKSDKNRWRTLNDSNSEEQPTIMHSPLSNDGDQYDYKLTYQKYITDKDLTHNSNYHQYSKPTLFLGLNRKNFNLYSLQYNTDAPDSITREYDNEWDFWMNSKKGQVSTKGLTLTWMGSTELFPAGSYMLRLAGGGHMPTGLMVDGVWPYGGKSISTDAGFFVFNNGYAPGSDPLAKVNDTVVSSALGQSITYKGAYQLFNYVSNDGNINNAKNNSLHLGLTKSSGDTLRYNKSPTCNDNGKCSVLGQVIFDPLGYVGGIALGSGQGEKTQLGLIVDAASNVIVNNKLTVGGKSVNDAIEKVENSISQSQMNVANGVAGLNSNKEVTANINSKQVYTPFMMLPSTGAVRFNTDSADTNNIDLNIFYNRDSKVDGWNNQLDGNTLYFTNNHYGNNYKFVGNMAATQKISATSFKGKLATPSSSTASCAAGEFKDDANYHYVCVGTNKWKRVALSDF